MSLLLILETLCSDTLSKVELSFNEIDLTLIFKSTPVGLFNAKEVRGMVY